MDNIRFQIAGKIEKLKKFFAEDSLKGLNIFGQFLTRAFESKFPSKIFGTKLGNPVELDRKRKV